GAVGSVIMSFFIAYGREWERRRRIKSILTKLESLKELSSEQQQQNLHEHLTQLKTKYGIDLLSILSSID
ncbi:MAG: hypothetical protein ACPG7F_20980, partial [Aggregatilineales bacterium]